MILLSVTVSILIALYLGFLIYIGFRLRMPAETAFAEVREAGPPVPDDVRACFQSVANALSDFVALGTFVRTFGTRVTQYQCILDHPASGDHLTACVTQADAGLHLRQQVSLHLVSIFADGTDYTTTTAQVPFRFARQANVREVAIPAMADPLTLRRVHEARVAKHHGITERKTPWRPACLPWLNSEAMEYRDRCIRQGYCRLDPRTGELRFTWKTILLAALARAWPVRQLKEQYEQWQANRLLRQLGLPTDYARTAVVKLPKPVPPQEPSPHEQPQTLFCPICDYNLTGLSANRCPECGQQLDKSQMAAWAAKLPKPITRREIIGEIFDLPVLLMGLVIVGAGFAFTASKIAELRWVLARIGILAIVCISGVLIRESYASCCLLAGRLAVTRARARGSEGSGLHDRAFIKIVWHAIFAFRCLMILAAAGVVLFLLM